MARLSPFQSLHRDIISPIVFYCASGECWSPKKKRHTFSIAHSCHNWRMVFFSCFYNTVQLLVNREASCVLFPKIPNTPCPPLSAFNHHVRDFTFELSSWRPIFYGNAFLYFHQLKLEDKAFKYAHSLAFCINSYDTSDFTVSNINLVRYHIAKFLRTLRSMAPRAQQITVAWPNSSFSVSIYTGGDTICMPYCDESIGSILSSPITDFVGNAKGLYFTELKVGASAATRLDVSRLSGMTYFRFNLYKNQASLLELIRRNASTLQSFYISDVVRDDAYLLLQDAAGNPMVYRCLEEIYIFKATCYSDLDKFSLKVSKQAISSFVHFPHLKKITSKRLYPFMDDVLFRGNSDTLEQLRLSVDFTFVEIATKYQIFANAQLPHLEYVDLKIEGTSMMDQRIRTRKNDVIYQLLQPAVHSSIHIRGVKLFFDHQCREWDQIIKDVLFFSRLCFLHIRNVHLSFSLIVSILRNMPCLRSLYALLLGREPRLDNASSADLPEYMRTELNPLNDQFHTLDASWEDNNSSKCAATIAILLSISYPRFCRFITNSRNADSLAHAFTRQLKTKMYAPYSQRAKEIRLLQNASD